MATSEKCSIFFQDVCFEYGLAGLREDLTFLDREPEDECSGTVSCGDVGSFAAKFSTNTRERCE
jgi:hypothetical protein